MIVMAECSKNSTDSDGMLSHLPVPSQCQRHPLYNPDPDLGLTPERSPKASQEQKKCVRFKSPAKSKARRKMKLENKENQTDLSKISLPLEPLEPEKAQTAGSKKNRRKPQQPIVKKETAGSATCERENHLDKPELHTTLNIGSDILKLQKTELDIAEALKYRLSVSEQDRAAVKQKTYSKLNEDYKESGLFGGAVSVNVAADVIIDKSEKTLQKSVKPYKPRPKPEGEKPSLMKFFKPELAFHRSMSCDQHGYQPICLQVRPPSINQRAFEQHQRISLRHTSNRN